MRQIKKAVLIKNAVETLGFFSEQIADAMEESGVETFFVDYADLFGTVTEMPDFVGKGRSALVTFNFIGLSGEDVFCDETGRCFWEKNEMLCMNILVDHPLYYHSKLEKYASGRSDSCKEMTVFCVDREHVRYVERFYPEIPVYFLPLAGNVEVHVRQKESRQPDSMFSQEKNSFITETEIFECTWKKAAMETRRYDLVFTGNYVPLAPLEQKISALDPEYTVFYHEIIEDLLADPTQSLDTVLERHIKDELGEVSDTDLCTAMGGMVLVDLYIRSWFRGNILKELAETDVQVHVFGADWEHLNCKKPHNLISNGRMISSKECLQAIADAKLSLNIMPWFKDGAHDRIFTSMLQKTAVITDDSRYLREQFRDGEEITYFSLGDRAKLPEMIHKLLCDEEKMRRMAEHGYALASKQHTWKQRTEILLRQMR